MEKGIIQQANQMPFTLNYIFSYSKKKRYNQI